jgi:hypothetical protein
MRDIRAWLKRVTTVGPAERRLRVPLAEYPPAPRAPGVVTNPDVVDLAIDFGTSAITAALVSTRGVTNLLRFGDGLLLDSRMARRATLERSGLGDDYELGPVAVQWMRAAPQAGWDYYPCLKRRIEWQARSGASHWQQEAVLDVAACCWKALDQARTEKGETIADRLSPEFRIFITVPNAFPQAAVEVLRLGVAYGAAAAREADQLPAVETLWEAEAVAYHELLTRNDGQPPDANETVLILDAGAGTTDASIVRSEGGVLRVIAHAGLPVGGLDLDAAIARLRDGGMRGSDASRALVTAREAKQVYWSATAPDGAAQPVEQACAGLAEYLSRRQGWPAERDGRPLKDALALAHRRYLALAVDALVGCLPQDELLTVDQVVVSGRASLLVGFADRVREALEEHGVRGVAVDGAAGEDRKLAVIWGVGDYVAAAGPKLKRRPLRAGFEMVLRHAAMGDPLVLIPAGHPLDEGWGVQAWYQPETETADARVSHYVDMRLIPIDLVRRLVKDHNLGWSYRDVASWSVVPSLGIEAEPPFTARVAYDFLTLRVMGEVQGAPVRSPPGQPGRGDEGRLHPVHGLEENWFENLHRRTS